MAVLLAAVMLVSQAIDVTPVGDQVETVIETVETDEPVVVKLTPREYLYAAYPAIARRLDCMIRGESTWYAAASGAGGRYIGLAQFDRPTWAETPQGKAGASRTDPYASIDAMAWGVRNLGYGRWPVTSRRC